MKAREALSGVDSPHRRVGNDARATETIPLQLWLEWLKRAILPAAISDPAASRLLAEAESREQPPYPSVAGRKTEKDDRQEQNSAYSPFTSIVRCP